MPKFVLRIAVRHRRYRRHWGDWHYACALAGSLRSLGHLTAVICQDEALPGGLRQDTDVVLDVRGPGEYPKSDAVSAVWVISHPESITTAVLSNYDLRFAASNRLADHASDAGLATSYLPQATDAIRFKPPTAIAEHGHRLVFVGSTRNVGRPVIEAALEQQLPVAIYGSGWRDRYGSRANLIAPSIENHSLPTLYSSAGAVLNDHLPSMREWGIVSNRVFDVLACGGRLVTDTFWELEGLTRGHEVFRYSTTDELSDAVNSAWETPRRPGIQHGGVAHRFSREHSFRARAETICAAVERKTDA